MKRYEVILWGLGIAFIGIPLVIFWFAAMMKVAGLVAKLMGL